MQAADPAQHPAGSQRGRLGGVVLLGYYRKPAKRPVSISPGLETGSPKQVTFYSLSLHESDEPCRHTIPCRIVQRGKNVKVGDLKNEPEHRGFARRDFSLLRLEWPSNLPRRMLIYHPIAI
jgi:hypothetical protein